MARRFCAVCGKDLEKDTLHYGMCVDCYVKEHPLFDLKDKYSFKICNNCGKYSRKEEWFNPIENQIFSIIEDIVYRFVLKPYLKKDNITFSLLFDENSFNYSSKNLLKSLDLTIFGTLKDDINIKHQQSVKINLNYELCKNCSNLIGGTYFLSIIQLRVKDEAQFNVIKRALDDIHEFVEKLFEKDNKQYISKIEDQKNGVDLFLSTNELMNHIISHLKTKFYFVLKRSKKLMGRDIQRSKNLYRLKTLIKFLPIEKKDRILIDNSEYIVENITKNKIILRSENSNKLIKDFSYFFDEKSYIKKESPEDV